MPANKMAAMATCPTCQGAVATGDDGALLDHLRYADGSGYGPDQSRDHVPCEGSGERPREVTILSATTRASWASTASRGL